MACSVHGHHSTSYINVDLKATIRYTNGKYCVCKSRKNVRFPPTRADIVPNIIPHNKQTANKVFIILNTLNRNTKIHGCQEGESGERPKRERERRPRKQYLKSPFANSELAYIEQHAHKTCKQNKTSSAHTRSLNLKQYSQNLTTITFTKPITTIAKK